MIFLDDWNKASSSLQKARGDKGEERFLSLEGNDGIKSALEMKLEKSKKKTGVKAWNSSLLTKILMRQDELSLILMKLSWKWKKN